jgi:hypothetical protein
MPDFFDPAKLDKLWGQFEKIEERVPDAPPERIAFERLESLVYAEFPNHRPALEPLLAEARELVFAQAPSPEGATMTMKELEANQARLAQILDTLEDLLDALHAGTSSRTQKR